MKQKILSVYKIEEGKLQLIKKGQKPTYKAIGSLFGVSKQAVHKFLQHKQLIENPRTRLSTIDTANLTIREIATKINWTRSLYQLKYYLIKNQYPFTHEDNIFTQKFKIMLSGIDTGKFTCRELITMTGYAKHYSQFHHLMKYHKLPYLLHKDKYI